MSKNPVQMDEELKMSTAKLSNCPGLLPAFSQVGSLLPPCSFLFLEAEGCSRTFDGVIPRGVSLSSLSFQLFQHLYKEFHGEQLSLSYLAAAAAAAKSLQSCPTLCDPIDSSPPGSPVPGILQARTLEWVAISFSNA